ncbi:uncharacterized protein LOC113507612 isoform X2 [Trichoplusia ni]|uniref:Uncharacterized protein LOC113507612 isoform X2 n=1 Tax=Trichoplusia ni TaxID=7111 RepID=A0A7E5X1D3_TRINI|nr:uncharacterized protein LOC113507612 isoform X2 [Trichoplusia ni]
MSYNNFNKGDLNYGENADHQTNVQEDPNTTIDMVLVKKEEAVRQRQSLNSESKNFVCVDVDDSIGPSAFKNDKLSVDIVQLNDTDVKTSVTNVERKKFTVLGLYDYIFGAAPPPPNQGRWGQGQGFWSQPPPPQQQSYWNQYGPSPGPQGPMEAQGQGYGGFGGRDAWGTPLMYDPGSRNSFVALVMSIVFVMIIVTAGFIAIVLATPDYKEFFISSGWLTLLPALCGIILVNYAMMCSPCARRPPCNFLLLLIATASMSVIAAKISSHYRTEIILYAVLATGAVVFVCILLACSKFDFTSWMLYVILIATGFSVVIMIVIITMMVTGTMMKPVLITILVIGTLIQIVMLTMNLQMVLGGRTIEICEEDYALASFLIYTSILDVFLKMMQIIGLANN